MRLKKDMNVLHKVRNYIKETGILKGVEQIVVGLSGGADSVCLLRVLQELQHVFDFRLQAVHVNHQIRGEEALQDENFSKELCRKLQIPFQTVTRNVPELATKQGISEEEAGRQVRYQAFEELAKQLEEQGSCVCIAVAHHQNDQAETVLHHLCRGTDLAGLAGMPAKNGRVIRPLLCLKRSEIEDYLQSIQQNYVMDSTNKELRYTRNRLRNQILPALETYVNEGTVEHMAQAAESMGEIRDYMEQQTELAFRRTVTVERGEYLLALPAFQEFHVAIQKRILVKILKKLANTHKNIEKVHIMNTVALIENQVGKQINLPYGIQVLRQYEQLVFVKQEESIPSEASERTYLLEPGQSYSITEPSVEIQTRLFSSAMDKNKLEKIPKNNCTKWVDYDRIEKAVIFRKGKKNDYLQLDKEGHHKQFNKLCRDEKISAREREKQWVIADGEHIIWFPGVRMSECYKITDQTEHILEITIKSDKV